MSRPNNSLITKNIQRAVNPNSQGSAISSFVTNLMNNNRETSFVNSINPIRVSDEVSNTSQNHLSGIMAQRRSNRNEREPGAFSHIGQGLIGLSFATGRTARTSETANSAISGGASEPQISPDLNVAVGQIVAFIQASMAKALETIAELENSHLNLATMTDDEKNILYHKERSLEIFSRIAGQNLHRLTASQIASNDYLSTNLTAVDALVRRIDQHLNSNQNLYVALDRFKLDETAEAIEIGMPGIQVVKSFLAGLGENPSINNLSDEQKAVTYYKHRELVNFMRYAQRDLDRLNKVNPTDNPYIREHAAELNTIVTWGNQYLTNNQAFYTAIEQEKLNDISSYIQSNMQRIQEDVAFLQTANLSDSSPELKADFLQRKNRLEIFSRIAGRDLERIDLENVSNPYISQNLNTIRTLVNSVKTHLTDNAAFYSQLQS